MSTWMALTCWLASIAVTSYFADAATDTETGKALCTQRYYYLESTTLTTNNTISNVAIGQSLDIEFSFRIHSACNSSYCNIFTIGSTPHSFLLALGITNINQSAFNLSIPPNPSLMIIVNASSLMRTEDTKEHTLYLHSTSNQSAEHSTLLQIDNIVYFNSSSRSSTYVQPSASSLHPLYFSNPWQPTVNWSIRNICISSPMHMLTSHPTSSPIATSTRFDVDTDDSDTALAQPICSIKGSDNWLPWIYLAVSFMFVSLALFFCMTRYIGIEISVQKWSAILMLLMAALSIASIFKALIATFSVMASYPKCNTLRSRAPLKPWDWQQDWEKDSLMGFAFWIIGVLISSGIYSLILMMKLQLRSVAQYNYEKIDCGERFIAWCVKALFFVVTFSFSAVLRPYYFVGHHSESDLKCACVDGDVGLIAEIYGAALVSILLAPCAYKCGVAFVADDEDENKSWLTMVIGCMLFLYAGYCAFIVIAAPFLFIAFRVMEYVSSAQHVFTADDFTMFVWLFEAITNFLVDLKQ